MSKIDDKSKKRKGASEPSVTTKKVKTTTTEKPTPKSAMKKTETVKVKKTEAPVAAAPAKAAKPARKRAEDFLEPEPEKAVKKTSVKTAPGKVVKTTVTESAKPVAEESAASKVSKTKAKGKNKSAVAEDVAADESESEDGAEEDDQTAALLAGFESSEDENDPQDEGIPLDKVPAAPSSKELRKQLKDAEEDPESTPGVIYVGRIPHGFYENQMREYFSQFGDISHLRMARNKLTGRSKHYAFLEFASAAVADIVAKTMDKYLLFGHILQVRRIPAEQVHEKLWKGEGRRFKVMPRNKIEGGLLKRGTTREGWEKRIQRETKQRSKKADQLKAMGYDFEMPALRSVQEVPTKDVLDAESAALPNAGDIKAVLDKQQEPEAKVESKKATAAEKAGTKRVKSKGDGKKASKKAKVSA